MKFNPQKTEHENCKDNHIYRVFDAGKKTLGLERVDKIDLRGHRRSIHLA